MKNQMLRVHKIVLVVVALFLFLTACNQSNSILTNQNKTISIKVALVYKMGVQPVARTKFYLLNKDLQTLEGTYLSPSLAKYLSEQTNEENQPGINERYIKDAIVATASTDFEGNAKFENVPKGVYYVAGFTTTRTENGYAVWSIKVDTESVKDTLLLDQNNAFKAENN